MKYFTLERTVPMETFKIEKNYSSSLSGAIHCKTHAFVVIFDPSNIGMNLFEERFFIRQANILIQ